MALWCLLVAAPLQGENAPVEWAFGVLRALILLAVLLRGGLLALTVSLLFLFASIEVPLTLDAGAWYASRTLPVVIPLLAIAVYGFYTSLGGKPMFGALDD
jgi:hypothetical protein